MDLEFLTSNRFWALIIGAASTILLDPNAPNKKWYVNVGQFLAIVSAGFITIRTVDRGTEILSQFPSDEDSH